MKPRKELEQIIISMGCKSLFKPRLDKESDRILLMVRRSASIQDGRLLGSEIDVYDSHTFRVWTGKVRKAKELARQYGLKIRLLDGECELFIPVLFADSVLPIFGAKAKRALSEEARARLLAIGFRNRTEKRG